MIFSTKKELKEVINVERRMNGKGLSGALVDSIFQRPAYLITKYLKHLRYLEFYQIRGGIISKLFWLYHYYHKTRLSYKLGYQIPPGTCGKNLILYHYSGGIVINAQARLGDNCKLYPGLVVGSTPEGVPTIGNNVWIGPGVKIVGKIFIGDNVIIAPNSVVQKNIPSNVIVGGIPAKVIKQITAENYSKYQDYILPF